MLSQRKDNDYSFLIELLLITISKSANNYLNFEENIKCPYYLHHIMTEIEIKNAFFSSSNIDELTNLINNIIPIFFDNNEQFSKILLKSGILPEIISSKNKLYKTFEIPKKHGFRKINAPSSPFKEILQILNYIFQSSYENHRNSYAYIPKRSIIGNAQNHVNRNYIYSIDLENFFPSITLNRIKSALFPVEFIKEQEEDLATIIAQLCTYKEKLPQGAPTSPTLSNLVCKEMDNKLYKLAKKHRAKYSRYADDITFSCNKDIFNKQFKKELRAIIKEEVLK